MRKYFSVGRKQVTVILTIAILAVFAAWYYLAYIPGNEKELNEQHFRWLQRTDKNIRTKIEASDSLMSNLLRVYQFYPDKEKVETYIRNYSTENGSITAYIDKSKDAIAREKINERESNGPQFILSTDTSMTNLIIRTKARNGNSVYNISMNYNFEKFIKPLLQPDIFDHYIIFYNGRYIYEDFHSGMSYNAEKEDSLLKAGKGITGSTIIDQQVGGVTYKMFLQPVNFFGSKKLIIAGLHVKKRFIAEAKQLPPAKALLAIILAIGVLLFLPWIRISFLGKYDRLTLADAAGSLLVAKLLMSLLVLFLFKYNNFSCPSGGGDPSQQVLSNKISTAFINEVNSAYNSMNRLDTFMKNERLFYDFANLGKDSLKRNSDTDVTKNAYQSPGLLQSSGKSIGDSLNKLFGQFPFKEINWLDSTGNVIHNWTTSGYNNVHANYKDREYFKDIMRNNVINPKANASMAFTINQLISRTDGGFRTVMCKKSVVGGSKKKGRPVSVMLMSYTMGSLEQVIMPAGYSFAIIDNSGEVKYHSNADRGLNENLKEEFLNKKELQDALNGRFKEVFETKYYEDNYSVNVNPIKGYPYFIVVMNNKNYPETVDIETFAFSWGMICLFLIVVLFDLFILIMASSRRSLFKKQSLVTSWLWPRQSSRNEYLIAGKGNIVLALFLLGTFHTFRYLPYFFVLLFCIPLLTIFLNTLFLHKYKAEKYRAFRDYKVRCAWWSAGFLALLNILAVGALGVPTYGLVFLFELVLLASGWLLVNSYNRNQANKEAPAVPHSDYLRCYTFMVVTRLLVTSAIPVIFFYSASYNFEQNLMARNRQYEYVTRLKEKYPDLSDLNNPVKDSTDITQYRKGIYTDSTWLITAKVCSDSSFAVKKDTLSGEEEITANMFNLFGEYFENISGVSNDNFYKSYSDDGYFHFNNIFRDVLYDNNCNTLTVPLRITDTVQKAGITAIPGPGTKTKWLVLKSAQLNYNFPPLLSINGAEFWLLLLVALLAFYFILFRIVRKVCSLDIRHTASWKRAGATGKKMLPVKTSLWIVGLPAGEIMDMVIEDLKKPGQEMNPEKQEAELFPANRQEFVLDFDQVKLSADKKTKGIDLQEVGAGSYLLHITPAAEASSSWEIMKAKVLESDCPYAILMHFENRLEDAKIMAAKLDCIAALLQKDKKIILISPTHPLYIQEMLTSENVSAMLPADTTGSLLINTIFNNFPIIILPLQQNQYGAIHKDETTAGEPEGNLALSQVMEEETKYTGFLKQVRELFKGQKMETATGSKKLSADMLTLKIQSFAHNFYAGLWCSLSMEEKFILYDLAEDGLVNIKNSFAVNLLINKGLINIEEGHLHIFNRSFRNFIVSAIGDNEMMEIDKLRKKGSNWGKLQLPLLLLVVGIFVFLGLSQEGIYTKMVGVISGVAAGIPVVLKLLSMMGVQTNSNAKNVQASSHSN